MTPVTIEHVNAVQALELRDQLLDAGLVQHVDFEWAYHQAVYDHDNFSSGVPRQVIFQFQNPTLATFWQLKFGR